MTRIPFCFLVAMTLAISFNPASAETISTDSLLFDGWEFFGFEPGNLSATIARGKGLDHIDSEWKFRQGDDPSWADPSLDDSDWKRINPKNLRKSEWRDGIAWFRTTLEIDPELIDRPLALVFTRALGAFEVFLDGKQIDRLGVVGDSPETEERHHLHLLPRVVPIVFHETQSHVLAVRSSYNARPGYKLDVAAHPPGFMMAVATAPMAAELYKDHLKPELLHRVFVTAMPLGFALLHLMIFLFYPKLRSHLYYSIFTFTSAFLVFLPLEMNTESNLERLIDVFRVMGLVLVIVSLSGLRFLYEIVYERMPRIFWGWIIASAVAVVAFWNGPLSATFVFILFIFVDILRLVFLTIARRKPAAWLIALGVGAFILTSTFQILVELKWRSVFANDTYAHYVYLYGLLFMLIMMSIYLGRDFARTSISLGKQLVQVRELSARTIEQERRVKEQEMARIQLEADNAVKAKELEETRKRQKVLDELEATNKELRETQSQLVHSEKMASLGSLVAGVAHEINTPIGAISSMHDTLLRAVGKLKVSIQKTAAGSMKEASAIAKAFEVIDEANNVIESGSTRVINIVKRLRSFARLDEAELKKADIHEGINDTLALAHHELKRNITVTKHFGKVAPIACFPGQLNQVFLNILVNASQAIEGDGEITITTIQDDAHVTIKITDTGKGIPKENLDRVFDPGFTTKGVGVGTGLGLSICYQIIQAHRGRISASSDGKGKGTTFAIVLPTNLDKILETT